MLETSVDELKKTGIDFDKHSISKETTKSNEVEKKAKEQEEGRKEKEEAKEVKEKEDLRSEK